MNLKYFAKITIYNNMNYVNEIQVLYKPQLKDKTLTRIKTSDDIYNFLKSIWTDDIEYRERFYAIYLNRQNYILGYYLISIGVSCATAVEPKMIFQPAINLHASAIILSHNHPSGNLKPSQSDIQLTNKICKAGDYLEIPILDHLVITTADYYSFANKGILK